MYVAIKFVSMVLKQLTTNHDMIFKMTSAFCIIDFCDDQMYQIAKANAAIMVLSSYL